MALTKITGEGVGAIDDLTVDTNTLHVDAANNRVGVGTTSPSTLLHLSSASPRITLTDTDTGADHRINADSGAGNLAFDIDFNSETASPSAVFNIKGSERLRILSGGGLTFNGDTAAANALDDYEEGTFTPVAIGETTTGTGTYSYQVGHYTKIGNFVHFQANMQWSAHTGSGVFRMENLPFTCKNVTNLFAVASFYGSGLPVASNHRAQPFLRPNNTTVNINQENGSGGASSVNIDGAAQVLITGTYIAQ